MAEDHLTADSIRAGQPRARHWRRMQVRLLFLVFLAALGLIVGEAGCRLFWLARAGVPLTDPGRILYAQYPGLAAVDANHPSPDDGCYDVLLLGASTLHADFGPVETMLRERLLLQGRSNVRIYNLGVPAHTSRDSRLKYEALPDARFDLVVIYDGINEARANNVPPEVFQGDYSHFCWYQVGNRLAEYHGRAWFALPCTLDFLATRLYHAARPEGSISVRAPRSEWLGFGQNPRSATALRENLGRILEIAEQRSDRVVLMTFATHFAPGYTLEKFQQRQLDYCQHVSAVEVWGRPADVENTVAEHNAVIRELAAEHPEIIFVDQATQLERGAETFNDVCHFTALGCLRFVDNLVSALDAAAE